MSEVDDLELETREREETARAAEKDLIERLQAHGVASLWQGIRDRVHCQAFLESRTGKRVTERLIRTVLDAQNEWLISDDPRSPTIIEAHRRAQAAHMAIFVLDETISEGAEAERELEQIQRELGE